MSRLRRLLGVVLVGSMVLVGCGGDGDSDVGAPASGTGSSGTGSPGGSGDDGGLGSVTEARCLEAATAMVQAAGGFSTAFTGASDDLRDSVAAFEAFADSAPSAIRDDLQTVAQGYAEFVKVLVDANFSPASGEVASPELIANIEAATEKLNNSDFEAAASRVEAWFDGGCRD